MNPQLPDTGAIFPAVLGNDSLAKALEVFKEETLLQTHLYILTPTHPSTPIPFLKKCKSINTLLHKCQALAMTFISWQGVMCLTGWVSQAYNCYNAVPSDIWQFYSIVFGDKIHKMFSNKKHIECRNKQTTMKSITSTLNKFHSPMAQ